MFTWLWIHTLISIIITLVSLNNNSLRNLFYQLPFFSFSICSITNSYRFYWILVFLAHSTDLETQTTLDALLIWSLTVSFTFVCLCSSESLYRLPRIRFIISEEVVKTRDVSSYQLVSHVILAPVISLAFISLLHWVSGLSF